MKPISMDAILSFRFLSGLQYAPGGRQAAVVVSRCDEAENGYVSTIWLLKDGTFRQLTGLEQESTFVWEDETHILFPAVRSSAEKKRAEAGDLFTVFYRISTEGGEALPAFEVPFPATGLQPAGEGRWLITGAIDADAPDLYRQSPEERETWMKKQKEEADYQVLTELPFYFNGAGFIDRKRTALFLYDAGSGEIRRLSDPSCTVSQAVYRDETVFFLASRRVEAGPLDDADLYGDLYRVRLPDGEAVRLTRGERSVAAIAFVSGQLIAAAAEKKRYEISADESFYLVDPDTGRFTLLLENDLSLGNSTSSDCRYGHGRSFKETPDALYLVMTVRNASHLYKLTADGILTPVLTKEGSVDDFDVTDDGQILVTGMYDNRLEEVYALDGGLTQLSHFNDDALADVYVAGYNRLTVPSRGRDIDGWVLLPKDFDEGGSYPAILDIHGGPRTVYGEIYFHEMQYWAGQGYFVFFCNPSGGSGRGLAFADICGKYGQIDYENIMDFTDAVLARWPQIDPKRLGCTGGSYGGFMSNWILGHTDRFAAIATQRSISNWVSFYGQSDIGFPFSKTQMGADIYSEEGVRTLWDHSPLKYAANMKTPTLLIHSFEDYRCPIEQGKELFVALKEQGVPARMCCFKGENHELSRSGKPKHRLRRLQEITNWMNTWTRG